MTKQHHYFEFTITIHLILSPYYTCVALDFLIHAIKQSKKLIKFEPFF